MFIKQPLKTIELFLRVSSTIRMKKNSRFGGILSTRKAENPSFINAPNPSYSRRKKTFNADFLCLPL